jgi:hypothetical protein
MSSDVKNGTRGGFHQLVAVRRDVADLKRRMRDLEDWRRVIEAWKASEDGVAEQRFKILQNVQRQQTQVMAQLAALLTMSKV